MKFTITSVKGTESFESLTDALRGAINHLNKLDPAFGVTIESSHSGNIFSVNTIADCISEMFFSGDDFTAIDGITLENACIAAGASIEYGVPRYDMPLYDEPEQIEGYDPIHKADFVPDGLHVKRYVFPDGSAIITNDIIWDIEGDEPFTWKNA